MSSYHVDPKTNLPLLYLKDSKETLWQKFEAAYPDKIKRTSFMACLAMFDTLTSLVRLHIEKESWQEKSI
ncbi:hypothetical protein C1645_817882 [Glomus cerebriforme]|uniref:Uncharacterized protein n=1 Tax=Glomus cerebriforme TaxID=658196 RepID=A0A397TC38_9GLOM|nr:hypothetical protein C1645_817882 [Glomus cerebriforme]